MDANLEQQYKQRYIDFLKQKDADGARSWAGEGSYTPTFNEDAAKGMSFADLVKAYGDGSDSGWANPSGVFNVSDEDPAMKQFRDKFGAGNLKDVELQNQKLDNNLRFSYTKPEWFKDGAQDNTRIMQLDDGRWVWENNNLDGAYVQKEQAKDADSGFFHGDAGDILKVAAFFAAAYGANALLEAGAGTASSGVDTFLPDGPGPTPELSPGAPTPTPPPAGPQDTFLPDGPGPTPPGPEAPPPGPSTPTPPPTPETPPPTTPSSPPPAPNGTANPFDVTPTPGAPPAGNGLINSVMDTVRAPYNWYNNLTPASRQIVGGALSLGARAALSHSAQQTAIQAQRDAEERSRQDTIRRGQVPNFAPNTYSWQPLAGGLIASNRGGK